MKNSSDYEGKRVSESFGPRDGRRRQEEFRDCEGRLAGIDPEGSSHYGDDMVPVVEEEPLKERGKLLEECDSGAVVGDRRVR